MATTKAVIVDKDDVTMTAGAGDVTTTSGDYTTDYSITAMIKFTNGATGPTIAAQAIIEVSSDNTNFYQYGGALVAGTGNNEVSTFVIKLPPDIQRVRTVTGSNTDQAVTARIEFAHITAVS